MEKIITYRSINEATSILDNGGRFYNVLTKADDGQISTAELGKVAGLFNDKQKMVLYFAMSTFELDKAAKQDLKAALSDDLKSAYEQYFPDVFLPSEAAYKGVVSSNAIITGIPKLIESKSDFNGFIMVPVSAGIAMTLIMIPIIDQYDVYEIRDHKTSTIFLIAHSRGSGKLPEKELRVGGVLKELKLKKEETGPSKMFLESLYYTDIS